MHSQYQQSTPGTLLRHKTAYEMSCSTINVVYGLLLNICNSLRNEIGNVPRGIFCFIHYIYLQPLGYGIIIHDAISSSHFPHQAQKPHIACPKIKQRRRESFLGDLFLVAVETVGLSAAHTSNPRLLYFRSRPPSPILLDGVSSGILTLTLEVDP